MKNVTIRIALMISATFLNYAKIDVSVVGELKIASSLARLPVVFIDMCKEDLQINFIPSRGTSTTYELDGVSAAVCKIAEKRDKTPGNVALLFDLLWTSRYASHLAVPESSIKIAYSMIESTKVPNQWISILNRRFDAVVVPDQFLVKVYSDSGVTIPIFVLPCPLYLHGFLNQPIKDKINTPFTFGMSAVFYSRKNFELLIDAFAAEFGNNPDIQLILHARGGLASSKKAIYAQVAKQKVSNIIIFKKSFNQTEYEEFLASLDCYVFLSKGEGFSITPRESLALGIPCILSNNTVHKTICDTGFVYAVPSAICEPAYYGVFKQQCGYQFNCEVTDVRKALRTVYTTYPYYLSKAHRGRKWVQQYAHTQMKNKFLSLVKPQSVILGKKNVIEDTYLITDSKPLYDKYCKLLNASTIDNQQELVANAAVPFVSPLSVPVSPLISPSLQKTRAPVPISTSVHKEHNKASEEEKLWFNSVYATIIHNLYLGTNKIGLKGEK